MKQNNVGRMKNKLISDDRRKAYKEETGSAFPEERHSGRSTALALSFIGAAMINNGCEISVYDHYMEAPEHGKRRMVSLCGSIIRQLRLLHFFFGDTFIRYDIMEKV